MSFNFLYRYAAEMPIVIIQSIIFLGIIVMTRLARPSISKLCYRHSDKSTSLMQTGLKFIAIWSILAAYIIPFAIIPRTIHPLVGWTLYFLGSIALSSIAVNSFLLPVIPVFVPLVGIFGSLLVMACPWYPNGVIRALAVFGYAFCYAPIAWGSLVKIIARLQVSLEREQFFQILRESSPPSGFNKLYWDLPMLKCKETSFNKILSFFFPEKRIIFDRIRRHIYIFIHIILTYSCIYVVFNIIFRIVTYFLSYF